MLHTNMMDSLHSLCSTSSRRRMSTRVALWGLRANRWGSSWVIAPSWHAAVKSVHPEKTKTSYEENYKYNKFNILACNDNHIAHHFISICSFFLTKDYLWYLVIVDGWAGLRWARCEVWEVECSVAFIITSVIVLKFLRFSSQELLLWSGDKYMMVFQAAGLQVCFLCSVFGAWLVPPVDIMSIWKMKFLCWISVLSVLRLSSLTGFLNFH